MKRHLLSAAMIMAVLVLAISTSFTAEKRFEKKFNVHPGETLTLNADVGSVSINGTSSSEVSIVADIKGGAGDVRDFEITAEQTSSGVEVSGHSSRMRIFSWGTIDVHFAVSVPRNYNVKVTTAGGDIAIKNVKGTVQGETSGGNLKLADVEGSIDIVTSGGEILLDRISGNAQGRTSGGDVTVNSNSGDIDVKTSGGDVRVKDAVGKVRATTSGGDVTVRIKGENKGVFVETSGGNIDIALPPNVTATVDAETSGGDVNCDLPLTIKGRVNEGRIRGTINGGGNAIHAHTSGGDIHIRSIDAVMK